MSSLEEDAIYPCDGKGTCIIIANFYGNKALSNHLPGYLADHRDLKKYFEDDLNYEVITSVNGMRLLNLSRAQFEKAIIELQALLNKKSEDKSEKIDKLVVFVMSHGGQSGVCMCAENSNGEQFEIDGDGNTVCITVEEIINHFTHDNIALMEGIPKCFIIQACRGLGYVQPAGPPSSTTEMEADELQRVMENPSIRRANIMVAHATLDKTLSYVHSHGGSWFLATILEMLKARSQKDDIFSILTKVIRSVCDKRSSKFFAVNHPDVEVCIVHNGKLRPILIYGKLSQVQNEVDEKYTKGMPLYPGKVSYTHFAPSRQVSPYLEQYLFTGSVSFRMAPQQNISLSSITAECLKPFSDQKYFKIQGILKNKASGRSTDNAIIDVHGDSFEVINYQKPRCGMDKSNLKIYGFIEEEDCVLEEQELVHCEARLYIQKELYHIGKLEKYNEVWGITAPIYQLPVVSSTLTKKMYLTAPDLTKKDGEDQIDATIEFLKGLKVQNKPVSKNLTPGKSSQVTKEGPKTSLEADPEPEFLPAGATKMNQIEKEDNLCSQF